MKRSTSTEWVMNMFCTSCGASIEENEAFCHACGAPVDNDGDTQPISDQGAAPASPLPADATVAMPPMGSKPAAASAAATSAGTAASPFANDKARLGIIIGAAAVAVIAVALIIALVIVPRLQAQPAYSISFETDGGTTIAATQVDKGALVTSPANPTKDGYSFEGWYSDPGLTRQVAFPITASENLVLYAKWSEKEDSGKSSDSNSVDINVNVPGGNSVGTTVPYGSTYGYSYGSNSSVSLTVVGSDGTTRSATIRRQGSTQRVLPDGNSRRYSASELASLSDAERCIAWNEIIAASNGYAFKNSGLASYFNGCSWYHRNYGASAGGSLNSNAQANVDLLQSMTDSWWLHLAAN